MAWSTYLFSALLATTTPAHVAPPTKWTVIVGGATADTSIYANAFFPRAIEVGVGGHEAIGTGSLHSSRHCSEFLSIVFAPVHR